MNESLALGLTVSALCAILYIRVLLNLRWGLRHIDELEEYAKSLNYPETLNMDEIYLESHNWKSRIATVFNPLVWTYRQAFHFIPSDHYGNYGK